MTSINRRFDPNVNYYAVLDLPADASRADIIRAYRQQMRRSHPDNFSDPDARKRAEERAKDINAAYAVLSRPEVRREYDMVHRRRVMSETVADRYRTYAPGSTRPTTDPLERHRRQRTHRRQKTREVQRSAFNNAIRQLVIAFGGIALALILLIILGTVALEGLRLLFV